AVTLLLEDVHWADEMSIRLLCFLSRRVSGWPVLIVASAREEELVDAPALDRALEELSGERHFVHLTLGPLSANDTASLVRSSIRLDDPAAAAPLEARIWQVSQGNPFVIVETLRALGEERALSTSTASLPLPGSVSRVIASRLQRLSDRGRTLAAVAAIIGRAFEFPLLARAAALDEREAAEGVEELVRRRVLHGIGERFDFIHDRVRDVVFGQILSVRRKLLHAAVGSAL